MPCYTSGLRTVCIACNCICHETFYVYCMLFWVFTYRFDHSKSRMWKHWIFRQIVMYKINKINNLFCILFSKWWIWNVFLKNVNLRVEIYGPDGTFIFMCFILCILRLIDKSVFFCHFQQVKTGCAVIHLFVQPVLSVYSLMKIRVCKIFFF